MKRLFLLMLTIFLGAGLVFLVSCGGDDEPTSSAKKTGDPEDSTFLAIQELVGENNFNMNMMILGLNFELIDSIPSPGKAVGKIAFPMQIQSDYIKITEYHASNFWHIFACSVLVISDEVSFSFKGIDSLRFGTADGYAYFPDPDSITSLNIRAHFLINMAVGNYMSADMRIHASYDLTGTYGGDFTINGLERDTIDMAVTYINNVPDTINCSLGMNYGETITNLFIDSVANSGGCPPSGSVVFNLNLDLGCDGSSPLDSLDIEGNWLASFTFANDNVTRVYENATTRWTVTEQCRGIGKQGWAKMLAALRR